MQYVVGLTGLIGSGKSSVASIFNRLGIDSIDTDTIAHQITQPGGAAILSIIEQFGTEFINVDGSLNRTKMRELVFVEPNQRECLESILHPLIYSEVIQQIKISKSKYVIVMVPLLFKAVKYLNLIHRSIFVDCKENILITRVSQRSGLAEADVKAILKTQVPRATQLRLCDDVLDNSNDIVALEQQVIKLNSQYQQLFKA